MTWAAAALAEALVDRGVRVATPRAGRLRENRNGTEFVVQ